MTRRTDGEYSPEYTRLQLAWIRAEVDWLKLQLRERKYRPDQPRVPAGSPQGGEWTGASAAAAGLRGSEGVHDVRRSYNTDTRSVVVIPPTIAPQLQAIGRDFTAQTGEIMLVTSGTRTPEQQAAAMYDKFHAGGSGDDYRNKTAFAPIRRAYDAGQKARASRAATVEKMMAIIQDQADRGVYISKHMIDGAADIHTQHMLASHHAALLRIARNHGAKTHPEGHPIHLHIEFGN